MSYRKPSRAGKWILSNFLQRHNHDTITGDFEEYYYDKYDRYGYFFAYFWFWLQVVKSLPSFLKTSLHRSTDMIKSYLKVALRNMSRNKTYSFINISGLAMGMASFILITLYIQYELSYDGYHENVDRIFNVYKEDPGNFFQGSNKYAVTPAPLGPALEDEYPEVLATTRLQISSEVLLRYGDKKFIEDKFFWMDPGAFEIFTFPFVAGNPSTALNDPFSMLLSESAAKKYFGESNPLNKTIVNEHALGPREFKVTGVFRDVPDNSLFAMDIVIPFETFRLTSGMDLTDWESNYYYTYALLAEGSDPKALESKFPDLVKKYAEDNIWSYRGQKTKFLLSSFKDIHFRAGVNAEIGVQNDMRFIYLLSALAFLILVIACINYMNLATAKSVQRSKEVGIRKVVGAYRRQLTRQFLSESIVFTFISLLMSMVLVYLFLPSFNVLVEKTLALHLANNISFVLIVFAVFIFVGLFAGSYPAFHISKFKPVTVLKGAFGKSTGGSLLRNALVVAQFSVSVLLIVCTLVIYQQLDYIKNTDVGYSKDQIVIVRLKDTALMEKSDIIKEELKRNANIAGASTSSNLPNRITSQAVAKWPGRRSSERIRMYVGRVDQEFLELYDIDIVRGRNFSEGASSGQAAQFLLNESAVNALGWEDPIGRDFTHWNNATGKIVGIVKNFR